LGLFGSATSECGDFGESGNKKLSKELKIRMRRERNIPLIFEREGAEINK